MGEIVLIIHVCICVACVCVCMCISVLVDNGVCTCVRVFNVSVVVKVAHRVTGFGCSCHNAHYVCRGERCVSVVGKAVCVYAVSVSGGCIFMWQFSGMSALDVHITCGCCVCPRGSVIVGDVCACVYQHSCR